MEDRGKKNEPTRFEVFDSVKSISNTSLARKVHPLMTWASYDKYQAHTWALRLIKANPMTGAETAAALVNYDYMVPGALRTYETKSHERKRYDAVLAAFNAWKIEIEATQIGAAA